MQGGEVKLHYRVENPWYRVGNADKVGDLVVKGPASAKDVYEAVEKEVGRIRVLYEIRPLQETRPLKKNGPEKFKGKWLRFLNCCISAGESIELKIQIQWPRGVRRYCEDHFQEIKLGSATNDRCECGRYNISNEEEVMCHTCALIKRVCCVCQKPVDTEAEEAAIRDECETYDVPVPDGIFPLDYKWLHRHDRETTQNY